MERPNYRRIDKITGVIEPHTTARALRTENGSGEVTGMDCADSPKDIEIAFVMSKYLSKTVSKDFKASDQWPCDEVESELLKCK